MWEELDKDVNFFLELMRKYSVDTLEIEDGSFKIRLVMSQQTQQQTITPNSTYKDQPTQVDKVASQLIEVKSPTVGTFWLKTPNNEILSADGKEVKEGQVIASVEMIGGIHYEVKAPANGKIVKILAQEGHGVEYDQVLMLIEPAGI